MVTTLAFNFKNKAPSQFTGFLANSAGVFSDKLYFASGDGVYVFDPGSEEEEVAASFVLPVSDFGFRGQKSPRSLVLGGSFDGAVQASVTDERGVTKNYVSSALDGATGCKIALDSDQRSRYLQIKVSNVDGAYFSVDTADLVFIPGPERRL